MLGQSKTPQWSRDFALGVGPCQVCPRPREEWCCFSPCSQMTPAERVTFERSWRMAIDAHDGRFSDALADRIIDWAREQPLGFEDARSMFAEMRTRTYRAHCAHRLPAG